MLRENNESAAGFLHIIFILPKPNGDRISNWFALKTALHIIVRENYTHYSRQQQIPWNYFGTHYIVISYNFYDLYRIYNDVSHYNCILS